MISKYSVKRPYTVLVAVVLVIVLGAVSLSKMTTDLLPDMSFQYALVITTDMGASPEQVESDVTAPIESAMATTSNIKNISSISYNSYSIVTLEYEQNANMDSVVIEIQQSLDQISGQWDDSIGTPMIMKVNPDMLPVLAAAVDMDGMDAAKLSEYVENELSPAIESLEGVASVTTTGQLEESVQVTLNQDKIDALNKKVQKSIDKQFAKSQKEIDANKKKVEDGQSSINTGSDQLTDAINQTMDKQQELLKTEKDLKNQLADLKKQQKSLSQIQSGIQTFMQSDAYTGIVSVLKDNPQLAESEEMKAQIKQLNKVVKEQFAALSSLGITVNTYEDLPAASAEVGKLLAQVNTGIKTIESAQKKVESGKVSLSSALDTLNANASLTALKVSTSSAELTSAASSLEDAQSKLDDAKDNAYDSADLNKVLSEDTITSLLAAQNFDMPAGYAMDGDTQYLVRVGDAVEDVEDLKKLPLIDMGIDGVKTICLSDVADVTVTDNSDETYAVINGNPGIMLSMEKQTGYSTGEVTDRILEKFKSLEKEDLLELLQRAITTDVVLKERKIELKETGAMLRFSGGDARKLLNILELVVESETEETVIITDDLVTERLQQNPLAYDKDGEMHYDIISAFIKSIRGSDPDGAIYWLARMVEGGEDPAFIARRLVISAAEDIGLANPNALLLANACFDTLMKIGWPEGRIPLAETTIYLATSPKSNSAYNAIWYAKPVICLFPYTCATLPPS